MISRNRWGKRRDNKKKRIGEIFVLDVIVAFLMGTLSGMGIGGGGLLVIYLTLFRGVGQMDAQGINLYFFLFASVAALFVHYKKRKIDYNTVLLMGVAGMPCAYLGAASAAALKPETVRCAFGYMLIVAGGLSLLRTLRVFFERKKDNKK